jgi:molecular chaperone GrpE
MAKYLTIFAGRNLYWSEQSKQEANRQAKVKKRLSKFFKMMNKENETPVNDVNEQDKENLNTETDEHGIKNESSEENVGADAEKIKELEIKVAEEKEKWLRLFSEFDNAKKRYQRERAELLKTAGEDVFKLLLPVIDDFERAMKANESVDDITVVKEGFNLIYNKMKNNFTQKGLEEMKCMGEPFNSDTMEAITNIPAPSEDLKGKVVEVVEKGYLLSGKVIRFAKVIVGS